MIICLAHGALLYATARSMFPTKSVLSPMLQMGKLRVHKSGKVKLHLGDVAFDMTRGIACEVCNSCIHKTSGRAVRSVSAPCPEKALYAPWTSLHQAIDNDNMRSRCGKTLLLSMLPGRAAAARCSWGRSASTSSARLT